MHQAITSLEAPEMPGMRDQGLLGMLHPKLDARPVPRSRSPSGPPRSFEVDPKGHFASPRRVSEASYRPHIWLAARRKKAYSC